MNEKPVRECIFVATRASIPVLHHAPRELSKLQSGQPRVLIDQSDYSARKAPLGDFVLVCILEAVSVAFCKAFSRNLLMESLSLFCLLMCTNWLIGQCFASRWLAILPESYFILNSLRHWTCSCPGIVVLRAGEGDSHSTVKNRTLILYAAHFPEYQE